MGDSPKVVEGTLRVAPGSGPLRSEHDRLMRTALQRGDKSPEESLAHATLRGAYHPTTLEVARAGWRERLRAEHHSSAVFARLLPQLMEAGATLDVKTTVLKMAMDELRHAGLSGGVLTLLGAAPEVTTNLATLPLPTHDGCSPREAALRNVLFVGCMSETVGVATLSHELELADEPAIRAVIDQLLTDEIWHAKLGWSYLAEVWPTLGNEERARTDAYMPTAFHSLEERMLGPTRHVRFDDALTEELNALGITAPQDSRALFRETVSSIVVPRFQELGVFRGRGNPYGA